MRGNRTVLAVSVVVAVLCAVVAMPLRPAAATSCPVGLCINGQESTQVQHHINVYLIFWGSYWYGDTTDTTAMSNIYESVHGTSWQGIAGQYNVYGTPTLAGEVIDSVNPLNGISQQDVINEVKSVASTYGWPAGGLDNQYIVLNPAGQASSWLGSAYCGIHTDTGINGYIYGDVADAKCGSLTNASQALTIVSSHEYAEMATDPYPIDGWTSSAGAEGEIGDLCNQMVGPKIDGAYVQMLYNNASQNCVSASTQGGTASAIVGAGVSESHGGYWTVGSNGSIFYNDGAPYEGSEYGHALNKPIVGMAGTHSGDGYWLVAADGGIFTFGDAGYYGSEGGHAINAPIVGIIRTIDDGGYWLVGADGGVYTFGDATFYGSEGGSHINAPIVGIARTPDSKGYWLVGSDGGIYNFGDAGFYGSEGGNHITVPVVGMSPSLDGGGYWLVDKHGGVYTLGDADFEGAANVYPAQNPVVATFNDGSNAAYTLISNDQTVYSYGNGTYIPN